MKERFDLALKRKILLFDGSMGALLASMGYKSRCPELLNVDNPGVIRDVHKRYVGAGAEVLITNTLGATSIKLKKMGLENRGAELVKAAVENARSAIGEDGYVALDVGSTGEFMQPVGALTQEEMLESFRAVCEAGKAAGADLILLETQTDIAECRAACLAARDTGLPVAASFTFEAGARTLTGGTPECCALTLWAAGASAMGVNCSGGPLDMLRPLEKMRAVCPLPVIVQPNAGLPAADGEGNAHYPYTPDMMTPEMERILNEGAGAIGGCCGTTPEHIRRMAQLVKGRRPPQSAWDGMQRICSTRKAATVQEAEGGLVEIGDMDELYDLEPDDVCAMIDLTGMSPGEARQAAFDAQSMTRMPLAFYADDAGALEAALLNYAGVAGAAGPGGLDEVIGKYGAKRLDR